MRPIPAVVIAILTCSSASPAQELVRSARITFDNDYLVFWVPPRQRTDDNYTQGARAALDLAVTPRFVRRVCVRRSACGTTVEVGQEIYTPTVDAPTPQPGERPYAGWLYTRAAARGGTARAAHGVSLTIGVTGPPSLAESVQKSLHRRIPGFRTPLGWDHQLPTEIAFAIRIDRTWRLAPAGAAAQWVDFVPSADMTLGTLRAAVGAGGRIRAGTDLVQPWLARPTHRWLALSAFVGGRADAIARDLFLDGSTFRESVRVERVPIVGGWERGVGLRLRRFRAEYRAVTRSREYRTGPRAHTHGSLTAHWTIR